MADIFSRDGSAIFTFVERDCACCASSNARKLGERGGEAHRFGMGIRVSVVQCRICGHIYPKPMPMLTDVGTGYQDAENYFRSHDSNRKIEWYKTILSGLARRRAGGGRCTVVDIGTGRGELLYAAAELGFEGRGVEPSSDFAKLAHSTYGVEVDNCTLEQARYADKSFDIAIMGAVIEHLYEPQIMLREIRRILKAGGLLWLDAPNEGSILYLAADWWLRLCGKSWTVHLSPTFPPYHVQGFTPNSLRRLLEAEGFKLLDLRLYPAGTLWPHERNTSPSLLLQYYGEKAVHAVEKIARTGSYMEAVACSLA